MEKKVKKFVPQDFDGKCSYQLIMPKPVEFIELIKNVKKSENHE